MMYLKTKIFKLWSFLLTTKTFLISCLTYSMYFSVPTENESSKWIDMTPLIFISLSYLSWNPLVALVIISFILFIFGENPFCNWIFYSTKYTLLSTQLYNSSILPSVYSILLTVESKATSLSVSTENSFSRGSFSQELTCKFSFPLLGMTFNSTAFFTKLSKNGSSPSTWTFEIFLFLPFQHDWEFSSFKKNDWCHFTHYYCLLYSWLNYIIFYNRLVGGGTSSFLGLLTATQFISFCIFYTKRDE